MTGLITQSAYTYESKDLKMIYCSVTEVFAAGLNCWTATIRSELLVRASNASIQTLIVHADTPRMVFKECRLEVRRIPSRG